MTSNIPSSYKGNTGENTVIEYVEDDVDELPHSDFSKAAARLFDKIDHGKASVFPSSKFFESTETFGESFIVGIWWVICRNYTQMKVVFWTVFLL